MSTALMSSQYIFLFVDAERQQQYKEGNGFASYSDSLVSRFADTNN